MPLLVRYATSGVLPAVVVEAGTVRMVIVPELGGRVVSLIDTRSQSEWLVQGRPPLPFECEAWRSESAVFGGREAFGWDECLPTVGPCPDPASDAGTLRDHGAFWGRPADVTPMTDGSDAIAISVSSVEPRWGLKLTRTFVICGPVVRIAYLLRNEGDRVLPWMWSMHALIDLPAGSRVELPAGTPVTITSVSAAGELAQERPSSHVWPMARWGTHALDLSRVPAAADWAVKLYSDRASFPLSAVRPDGSWIQFRSTGPGTRAAGIWLDAGGWPAPAGVRQTALEPTTAPNDDLAAAIAAGNSLRLAPRGIAQWDVEVELGAPASARRGAHDLI